MWLLYFHCAQTKRARAQIPRWRESCLSSESVQGVTQEWDFPGSLHGREEVQISNEILLPGLTLTLQCLKFCEWREEEKVQVISKPFLFVNMRHFHSWASTPWASVNASCSKDRGAGQMCCMWDRWPGHHRAGNSKVSEWQLGLPHPNTH